MSVFSRFFQASREHLISTRRRRILPERQENCTACRILALVVGAALLLPGPARALEGNSAFLRGITIGVPIGALPPPGTYFATFATQYAFDFFDAAGKKTGSHIDETIAGAQVLYVPDIPSIFGATYAASIGQPIEYNYLRVPGSPSREQFGTVNTIIQPIALSWKLPDDLHVSSDLTLYPQDGTYNVRNPASVGRHYATVEPGFAVSYVSPQWQASLHPVVDVNATNPANHYRSGTVLVADYAALAKFDRLSFGLGGTLSYQFTDDTMAGVSVKAVAGQHGLGNRERDLTIGPVIGYKIADVTVHAYLTQSVLTRNTAAGTSYYLTLSLPIDGGSRPQAAAGSDNRESAGPR